MNETITLSKIAKALKITDEQFINLPLSSAVINNCEREAIGMSASQFGVGGDVFKQWPFGPCKYTIEISFTAPQFVHNPEKGKLTKDEFIKEVTELINRVYE